ncbi:Arginase/deacetylase [Polychaeton citri CBS 116435]|uniref:Arginase/deacetylase n=1 Tax=Polychaeton citri CBS 116435 TaxID=1314669 RepID=A0A9P4QJ60_9PEZI|nr:Arginase/deacetylase [Polychaeton citri CBS 116435]
MDANFTPTPKEPPPLLARQDSQGSHVAGPYRANGNHSTDGHKHGSPAQMRIQTIPSPVNASPLRSAPNTPKPHNAPSSWPAPTSSRRQSTQALPSPLDRSGAATPLRSPGLRRANSSLTMRNSATPSPGGSRKGSRSSLGGNDENGNSEKKPTPKRSISNLISGLREAQAKMEPIEEPKFLTASDIANTHFSRQLTNDSEEGMETECTVILHDACYGHRFSRPKTTKGHLSMIVERPERINAAVLGAANAYVRMGQHHAGGANSPHPSATHAVPPPFKIRRTSRGIDLTSSYVTNVHGNKWMAELRDMCNASASRLAAGEKELSRTSLSTDSEKQQLHEGDLYLCPESLSAFQGALGGVADAVDAVFSPTTLTKRAFVGIRPPGHHCSADHPSGFCWLNNVHVGIEYACQDYGLTHAVILDFDLHHGDGSQTVTWARNKRNEEKRWDPKRLTKQRWNPEVGYYSLHDINSYPCEDGDEVKVQAASICVDNAHGQSVWNVHLEPWKDEDEFWRLYEEKYSVLLAKAGAFLKSHARRIRAEGKTQPRGAVFISAGFDASEWEGAGMQRHKVNVPTEFYARFTSDSVAIAEDLEGGCDGRVVSVLEGGYSNRALCSGVLSHLSGLCGLAPSSGQSQGNTDDIASAMTGLSLSGLQPSMASVGAYDRNWWSPENLTALENQVLPPPPPPPGKKHRAGPQPTYATPTESFAYKVRDSDKFARSIAGTMREGPMPTRPRTPPPPEVDWVTATQELHKLLVPTDRSTQSHTAEELAPVRMKKERQSAMAELGSSAAIEPDSRPSTRQLRERAAKAPTRISARRGAAASPYADSVASDDAVRERSVSRNDRRQTIADFTPAKAAFQNESTEAKPNRRLSGVSTTSSMNFEGDPGPKTQKANNKGAMLPPPLPRTGSTSSVQAKKVRAVSAISRPTKPNTSAVPSAPPVRSSHPSNTSGSIPVSTASSQTLNPRTISNPYVPTSGKANDETNLDALTTGMKRITLKVGTREESERKVREKQEAEIKAKEAERRTRALKAAETRRRNAEAKKASLPNNVTGKVPSAQSQVADVKTNAGPSDTHISENRKPDTAVAPPKPSRQVVPQTHQESSTITTESTDAGSVLPEWARLATNELADAVPLGRAIPSNPAVISTMNTSTEHQPGKSNASTQPDSNSSLIDAARRVSVDSIPTLPSGHIPESRYSTAAEEPLHLPSSPAAATATTSQPPKESSHEVPMSIQDLTNQSDAVITQGVHPPAPDTRKPVSPTGTTQTLSSSSRPVSRHKEDLPKFASTGFIPFATAAAPTATSAAVAATDNPKIPADLLYAQAPPTDVWDVPETPKQ